MPEQPRFNRLADPRLDGALRLAAETALRSGGRWARPVAWVLRSRIFLVCNLGGAIAGFNPLGPFLPLILIDRTILERAGPLHMTMLLLHESLHQLFVILPEWKLWINRLARWCLPWRKWKDPHFPVIARERIYGVGVNSADTITEQLMSGYSEPGSNADVTSL